MTVGTLIMMMMTMIRMMAATEERKGKVGGLPAEEEQLPPEGDNSGRSPTPISSPLQDCGKQPKITKKCSK